MRYIVFPSILLAALLVFIFAAVNDKKTTEANTLRENQEVYEQVQRFKFVKHEPSGLCFGLRVVGDASIQQVFGPVGCEDVKPSLITIEKLGLGK